MVFVDGARTPFGKAGKGMYAETRADDLIVAVIRELLRRHPEIPPERIDEVAIAASTQIGDQGLTIGRVAGMLAGLPKSVPGYAIDRMCAGGMTAVTTIAGSIAFGAYELAIAGGVEHMGRHPMGEAADPNPRFLADKLVSLDALSMGADRGEPARPVSAPDQGPRRPLRPAQPGEGRQGLRRGQDPAGPGAGRDPVRRARAGGWPAKDEPPRPGTTLEDLAGLKTPFRPHGRITAGNAAGLNDGATACILASADTAAELGLPVRMSLVGYGFAGVDPEVMGVGPIPSTERALASTGLSIDDIGLFELNEAFAVQVLAFLDHYGIDDDDPRVNAYGGAIALGHPLASSGVRLMTQLARQFAEHPEVRYGLTAMCVGFGQGGSVIWENPHYASRQPTGRRRQRQ